MELIQITELIKVQQKHVEHFRYLLTQSNVNEGLSESMKTEREAKLAHDEAVLQALCSVRWILVANERHTANIQELKQALSESIQVTKSWHCMGMPDSMAEATWNSYKKGAPEMAFIMSVVAKHANGKEASNG